jgi:hypothetical protein
MDYSTFEQVETLVKRHIENQNKSGISWINNFTLCCDDEQEERMTQDMMRFKSMPNFSGLTERDIYLVLVYFFIWNITVGVYCT